MMKCKKCFNDYNKSNRIAKLITPCGHTFCEDCLKKLIICPNCNKVIKDKITNFEIFDSIKFNSNLVTVSVEDSTLWKEMLDLKIREKLKQTSEKTKAIRKLIVLGEQKKIESIKNLSKLLLEELEELETESVSYISSKKVESSNILIKLNIEQLEEYNLKYEHITPAIQSLFDTDFSFEFSKLHQLKFIPVQSYDSISRNGKEITIKSNHQCMSAMKEYESKSLEEIRFQYYKAFRKYTKFDINNILNSNQSNIQLFDSNKILDSLSLGILSRSNQGKPSFKFGCISQQPVISNQATTSSTLSDSLFSTFKNFETSNTFRNSFFSRNTPITNEKKETISYFGSGFGSTSVNSDYDSHSGSDTNSTNTFNFGKQLETIGNDWKKVLSQLEELKTYSRRNISHNNNIKETFFVLNDSDTNLTKPLPTTPLTTKWTCSTCLVQNDDSKTSCACCSSLRQSSLTETKKLEEDNPLQRIQASFDMGWRVRSSGNKYGSLTGHALLIGVRSKKVLDSIVYNKNCTTRNKHMSLTSSLMGCRSITV